MAPRIPLLQSCSGLARLICADLSRVLNVSVVEFNAFVNRLGDPHGLPHSPTHSRYVELTKSSYQWKLTNASSSYPLVCQSREYICSMLLQAPAVCRLSSGVATGGRRQTGATAPALSRIDPEVSTNPTRNYHNWCMGGSQPVRSILIQMIF